MKKLFAILVAALLVMTMAVTAFAQDVTVELSADNWDGDSGMDASVVTYNDDGSAYIADGAIVGWQIPEIPLGETVTVTIKGSSVGDFRVWLLSSGQTTTSAIWKASENGFTTGDFEFVIELTAADNDGKGATLADAIAIKGPSYGVNLQELTINSIVVSYAGDVAVEEKAPAEDTTTEEAPVEDTTTEAPAEEETEAPADTGLALAVVPMIVALAAVVVSKRK